MTGIIIRKTAIQTIRIVSRTCQNAITELSVPLPVTFFVPKANGNMAPHSTDINTYSDVNIARHQTENMLEYDNKTCCFPWRPPMQCERGTKRRLDSSSMSVVLNKFEFLDSWHRRHLQLIWDYISRSMFHSNIKIGPNRVLYEMEYEAGMWRYYCAHFIFLIF